MMVWFRRTTGLIIPGPEPKTRHGELGSAWADLVQVWHFHCTKKWPRISRPSSLRLLCDKFHGAIRASITDAAGLDDHAAARCFDAFSHDAAIRAAVGVIAVG